MSSAYDDAVRILARQANTRRAVEERLAAKGHDPASIEEALSRLAASGAIDDAAFASTFAARRGAARGRDRVIAELEARGVDPELAASAWREAVADGGHDPSASLRAAVRRRLGSDSRRADRGRLARVYNALLSEGFEPEAIAQALRPYGFEGTDA